MRAEDRVSLRRGRVPRRAGGRGGLPRDGLRAGGVSLRAGVVGRLARGAFGLAYAGAGRGGRRGGRGEIGAALLSDAGRRVRAEDHQAVRAARAAENAAELRRVPRAAPVQPAAAVLRPDVVRAAEEARRHGRDRGHGERPETQAAAQVGVVFVGAPAADSRGLRPQGQHERSGDRV